MENHVKQAVTFAAAALCAAAFALPAQADKTMDTDVVVIGAGASGTAAGYAVAEAGAKVILLEKQPAIGGTGQFSEGIFAVESKMQRAMNYTLTKDQAFKLIMDYSHWRANAKLVRAFVEKSADTIEWLEKQGVEYEQLTSNYPGGLYTWHIYKGRGAGWIKTLHSKLPGMGAQVLLKTPAKELIQKDGKVVGVIAQSPEGEKITINAKAVVIASGGFLNNKEMMEKYMRFPNVMGVANVGKTGDGIQMAWKAGAAAEGTEVQASYRPGPVGESTTSHVGAAAKQPHLWLNPKGERFCDESIIFQWPFAGNALERQGGSMFVVFDQDTLVYMQTHGIDVGVGVMVPVTAKLDKFEADFARAEKNGVAFKAATLDELAQKTKMDPATLKAEVEKYNGYYTIRHDTMFAKDPKFLKPVKTGPFYAVKSVATSLGTLGGVKVSERFEAVTKEDKPVPGLYVVGNDAGGMYGDSYDLLMAGSTIGFAVNSGRIAAENIAKYIKTVK
jgi:fumarate reductase flavoprotein subunit